MKPGCSICTCDFRENSLSYNMLILDRIHVDDISRYVYISMYFCWDIISPPVR